MITAIPIGIAMGTSRIARGIADPIIEFYRPLPPLAHLPLIVIWLGIVESAKVTLIYLSCLAPLAMPAKAGVRFVAIEQINASRSPPKSVTACPNSSPRRFCPIRMAQLF